MFVFGIVFLFGNEDIALAVIIGADSWGSGKKCPGNRGIKIITLLR